jgi:hypothetical protein
METVATAVDVGGGALENAGATVGVTASGKKKRGRPPGFGKQSEGEGGKKQRVFDEQEDAEVQIE